VDYENEELLELEDIDDTEDALTWLGDKVEELFAVVTDDDLPDDAKAEIIQMMEEIQQYIDDAKQVIADIPESD
jgi:hypothetical protein